MNVLKNLKEATGIIRDELSILDGVMLKGTRIIIPEQCQDGST